MTRSELPDNWQDLAAGYILNNLSDEEVVSWEKLLEQYPEISNELEELRSAFDVFADTVPSYHPPDRLSSQIRAMAQTKLETMPPQPPALQPGALSKSSNRLSVLTRIGGAIAASIIAVLGVQFYFLHSQLQRAKTTIEILERELQQAQAQAQTARPILHTLQQPGTLIYSLEGSNLANAASGQLVISNQRDVIILVQNLPELSEGKVYRLWAALPIKTGLLYCGQFNSNTQGVIQLTPPSNQCGEHPTEVVITLDAATDPTTRGGSVVMQGRI
jgi:HAMP domain-containing protein